MKSVPNRSFLTLGYRVLGSVPNRYLAEDETARQHALAKQYRINLKKNIYRLSCRDDNYTRKAPAATAQIAGGTPVVRP